MANIPPAPPPRTMSTPTVISSPAPLSRKAINVARCLWHVAHLLTFDVAEAATWPVWRGGGHHRCAPMGQRHRAHNTAMHFPRRNGADATGRQDNGPWGKSSRRPISGTALLRMYVAAAACLQLAQS